MGTSGAHLIDHDGNTVRLAGVSWFGFETSNYAPHGLWSRSLDSMTSQIASLGFNSIRIPFCSQMFDAGSTPNGIDFSQNPTLQNKTAIEVLDAVIASAKSHGLKVILDRHRPDSGGQSPVWYTGAYSEQRWIDDWKMLAQRYIDEPTVLGADLHNEPHAQATWGDGNQDTDWRAAAERAGNAILSVNPDWLIVVEGVENTGGQSYWWGGNLRSAGNSPVVLNVPGRLVYSIHDYPPSVYMQSWFTAPNFPNNLASQWDDTWGYLVNNGTAPIWVGEFGTKLQTQADTQWIDALTSYISSKGLSFAYWSWNPNSGDTGGVLKDDWQSVNTDKMAKLTPILAPPIP